MRKSRPDVRATGVPTGRVPRGRLAVLVLVLVAGLSGLDAALLRLGATAPVHSQSLASSHGILMIYGFLGTAIMLERAVALQSEPRSGWAYAGPAAGGLGALLLVAQSTPLHVPWGRALPGGAFVASMALFVAIYVTVWRRQQSVAVLVQLLGAAAGLAGVALWARGYEVATIVPWWTALMVLTIVGERLELARVAFMTAATEPRILAESCVLLVALVATLVAPAWGYPLLGLALGVLMVDVGLHDVARRTVRSTGLTRFMGACMLAGYAWAMVPALVWMLRGPVFSGFGYDAVVHALTIGFVMSMVVAHAPVIVPAVARRPLPYHPVMWAVWAMLHAGLAIRLVADARASVGAWQLGGSLSVVALLAFLGSTVTLVAWGGRPGGRPGGRQTGRQAGPRPERRERAVGAAVDGHDGGVTA